MINNKSLVFIALALVLSVTVFSGYQYIFQENILVKDTHPESMQVCIKKDTEFNDLLGELVKLDVVHEPLSFAFIAKVMGYRDNVKPGCYTLKKGMTNPEAIRVLRTGDVREMDITFSNARFIEELAGDLTHGIEADSVKMLSLLTSDSVAKAYGFSKETFIAMFIPNTYRLFWYSNEQAVLDRMKKEYDKFWTAERQALAKKQNLTQIEVATLASIVQNESLNKKEQPKVAGLYLNRLNKKMLLQADPTVKFALQDFSLKRILYAHLEVDSPYNTYKYAGLPPGPISMPHVSSLEAVLNPDEHEYIYMCSIGDGSELHNFAKTNAEHNRNREIYKRNLKNRQVL